MAHDVFISHSVKDKVTADAVCATLESNGIRCWIAPRDVLPSMEWGEAIVEAIEGSRVMVLVFTANANTSPQIRREVERAVNCSVAILPLRIEDVLPVRGLDYFIGNLHWLDALTPPLESHLKNLASTIKILLARTEPGAPPLTPQEVKPGAGVGRDSAKGARERAGPREKAPALRHFWSARAWKWAAGTVAALALVAVLIGVHLQSHPAPVASPGPVMPPSESTPSSPGSGGATPVKPAVSPSPALAPTQSAPKAPNSVAKTPEAVAGGARSLGDTMKNLQDELSSIGSVSFTSFEQNKTDGSNFQYTSLWQVTNVVANPAQCRISYHWRTWQNGAVTKDQDPSFPLAAVASVVVERQSQYLTEIEAANGNPNLVVTSTKPSVTALLVRWPSGAYYAFPFASATLANQAAQSITQAVKLCGGHLAN
jgi:hypothetical protein